MFLFVYFHNSLFLFHKNLLFQHIQLFCFFNTFVYLISLNKQMYWINKMIEYVEKGDFYGIETKNYENKQKETSKAWLDLYLIDKNKLSDMRKQLMQIRQNIISKNIT